jgi:serine/threonine protein kinase
MLHAQHQGICHRDLKPENILLNASAGANRFDVKICDFGLCSQFTRGRKLSDFCGSPGFFAPEFITATSYDGMAVDIWSIG